MLFSRDSCLIMFSHRLNDTRLVWDNKKVCNIKRRRRTCLLLLLFPLLLLVVGFIIKTMMVMKEKMSRQKQKDNILWFFPTLLHEVTGLTCERRRESWWWGADDPHHQHHRERKVCVLYHSIKASQERLRVIFSEEEESQSYFSLNLQMDSLFTLNYGSLFLADECVRQQQREDPDQENLPKQQVSATASFKTTWGYIIPDKCCCRRRRRILLSILWISLVTPLSSHISSSGHE